MGSFYVAWKAWLLLGEPVVSCKAAWKIDSAKVDTDLLRIKSGKFGWMFLQNSDVPLIRISAAKIKVKFKYNFGQPEASFVCDLGAFKKMAKNLPEDFTSISS